MAGTKAPNTLCRTIYLTNSVDNELNQYIDGQEFRNRSHAVETIVKLWLKWRRDHGKRQQMTIFDYEGSDEKRK